MCRAAGGEASAVPLIASTAISELGGIIDLTRLKIEPSIKPLEGGVLLGEAALLQSTLHYETVIYC